MENKIVHYKYQPEDSLSISSNSIQTIFMDRDSIIWIGTNKGLNRYNRKNQNFIVYTTADGLCDNSIMGILEDNTGDLWISTNRGISKFNKESSTFSNYYVEDGLQSNQFTRGASHKSTDGRLYFGGVNGLTVFDPDRVVPRADLPEVAITGFYLFNQSVPLRSDQPGEYSYQFLLDKPIYLTESINLKYYEKIFSFDFSALDYVNPDKNQYAFMLEGLEDQWNYTTSSKRFTTYTNLDPGKYTLMVKATNSDGIWNETPTVLSIKVDPPLWKTWWAYTLYGMILIGIFYAYNRSHQKTLVRKQKELEKERLLNEKLNRADKLKDEFLANTSHELRTPLTGIIGITESLQDGVAGIPTDEMKSNLSLIISSAKRLSSLVNSILDFSKLKIHELQLSIKAIDLRTITEVVIQISQPLIKGKSLTLINEIDPSISLVEADEERLYQIMHNLIGNAIKFTDKGTIQVAAVEKPDVVQVCVKDTGIGIPEDKIEEVFKSFEQVDASVTREHGGTGLGLTITKQLVELHGGKIWIESKVGQGTSVNFTLPKSTEDKSTVRESQKLSKIIEPVQVDVEEEKQGIEEKLLPTDSRFNILIVDDEPINQKVLSNHLSRNNFKILHAMNGQEALEMLDREKLDLVLLDIMMPKMSGYEVCREIRKRYLPSELPVIMITAKNQIMDLVEGLDSGANDYLAKPFSKNELLARLKTHLNLYNINSAYLRFIPKEFIRALGHENIIDVKLGDHVQDEMTILFSDIRSFTTITENLSAEESFELLNEYLKHITPAISHNNGFIDKYIGDAVMALFHIKAEDAIKAAIEAQRNLTAYNEERKLKRKDEIHIGIGIHTGPLMMGTIGVEDRMDGTVISDAVNLASRLEELNKHYGTTLIVSQDTINRIGDLEKYNYRFLSRVLVKGKENPIRIYEIFDGDADHNKSMKLKTLPFFNEGIKEYYNRRFTQASVKFQEVLDIFPEDRTTQILLQQSAKYMVKGVPDNWDGVDVVNNVY
jgi:signal transduction histidine kinase/class 3 adenylate cyclase/DNA-binding NarL/FixJ family response regulator